MYSKEERLIQHALKSGITLLDTADVYGESERFVGKAIVGRREQVVLATKFGFSGPATNPEQSVDGSARYVQQACEASFAAGTRHRARCRQALSD